MAHTLRRLPWLVILVTLSALTPLVRPGAGAQQAFTFALPAGPDSLRAECTTWAPKTKSDSGLAPTVKAFCKASSDDLQTTLVVPRLVAMSQSSSSRKNLITAYVNIAAANTVTTTATWSQSAVLQGAVQFVSERAQAEIEASVLNAAVKKLCTDPAQIYPDKSKTDSITLTGRTLFPATCLILTTWFDTSGATTPTVAWTPVQAAIQQDIGTLPDTTSHLLLQYAIKASGDTGTAPDTAHGNKSAPSPANLRHAAFLNDKNDLYNFLDAALALQATVDATRAFLTTKQAAQALAQDTLSIPKAFQRPGLHALLNAPGGPSVPITRRLWFLTHAVVPALSVADTVSADTAALWTTKYLALRLALDANSTCAIDTTKDPWAMAFAPKDSAKQQSVPHGCRMAFDGQGVYARIVVARQQAATIKTALATRNDTISPTPAQVATATAAFIAIFPLASSDPSDTTFQAVTTALQHFATALQAYQNKDYATVVVHVAALATTLNTGIAGGRIIPTNDLRYIQFAADIAAATTAADAQQAINAFAAPPTAYQKKRTGQGYITFNAYLGLATGMERDMATPNLPRATTAWSGSAWLPLGVEFGHSVDWLGCLSGNWGLFVQIVDLGQVAAWRFAGPSAQVQATPPAFDISHVFSPGLFIVKPIHDLPLSWGFGASYSPQFREVNGLATTDSTTTASPVKANAWRFSAFFAVDVPIFP